MPKKGGKRVSVADDYDDEYDYDNEYEMMTMFILYRVDV
jgi:hypothetical protein